MVRESVLWATAPHTLEIDDEPPTTRAREEEYNRVCVCVSQREREKTTHVYRIYAHLIYLR